MIVLKWHGHDFKFYFSILPLTNKSRGPEIADIHTTETLTVTFRTSFPYIIL